MTGALPLLLSSSGHDLALVTADPNAGLAQVIERCAARWSIEVAVEDAKPEFGAGQEIHAIHLVWEAAAN